MMNLKWQDNRLSLNNTIERPIILPGEALVKVSMAGICNTDLEIMKGYFNFNGILGHEFVGKVVETKENNQSEWLNQRVVADINCSCYQCEICRNVTPHHCPHRSTVGIFNHNGVFAEYVNLPIKNLIKVPDHLPDQKAVFAEPIAAALEIIEQIEIKPDTSICVLGDGKLGLLIALVLAQFSSKVTLKGRHPSRKSIIANHAIEFITDTSNKYFDAVVEATGNPQGLKEAIQISRPRGTIVLKSTYESTFAFNPTMIIINELTLIGSRCGPIDKAINLLADGQLDPSPLINSCYPLSKGIQAITQAQKKGVLKVLLKLEDNDLPCEQP